MHVESTRLARLRAHELSATAFVRLAGLSVLALWLIVSTGAVVRLTSSGLGCEHWPGCQPGQPFPEKGYHSYIEFGNRMVASVTILLTLGLAVGAWLTRGLPRWARWLAVATFVGTAAQAPLGAITVYAHLHPALVIPHLLLSIGVLGAAVIVALEAVALTRGRAEPLDREPRLAGLGVAVACFALLASGTIATAAGPHSGGKHVYRLWRLHPALLLHGASVAVLGCGLMFMIGYLLARRSSIGRRYAEGAVGLAVLLLVQMAIGDIQYRTHLPWGLVLVHVAFAATVWAATVAFVTLMWRPLAAGGHGPA
ncbi:MAG TPA: COX15/CtaA family protein [Gaiellaceae bacterium]|nr:COX15/CtaA family protein [Gaiellaceae bacterium]